MQRIVDTAMHAGSTPPASRSESLRDDLSQALGMALALLAIDGRRVLSLQQRIRYAMEEAKTAISHIQASTSAADTLASLQTALRNDEARLQQLDLHSQQLQQLARALWSATLLFDATVWLEAGLTRATSVDADVNSATLLFVVARNAHVELLNEGYPPEVVQLVLPLNIGAVSGLDEVIALSGITSKRLADDGSIISSNNATDDNSALQQYASMIGTRIAFAVKNCVDSACSFVSQ